MRAKFALPAFACADITALRSARRSLSTTLAYRVAATLRLWRRRQRDRRALARFVAFDDRALADIGLGRVEAEFLINKPFWRE